MEYRNGQPYYGDQHRAYSLSAQPPVDVAQAEREPVLSPGRLERAAVLEESRSASATPEPVAKVEPAKVVPAPAPAKRKATRKAKS